MLGAARGWSCAAARRSTRRTASRSWARCARRGGRFAHVVERALAPPTAAIIGVCDVRARPGAIANGIQPAHAGGGPQRLARRATRRRRGGAARVGRRRHRVALRRGKGLDVLLDAAPAILAAVPEATIVIAGDGPRARRAAARTRRPARASWSRSARRASNHLRELDVYVLAVELGGVPDRPAGGAGVRRAAGRHRRRRDARGGRARDRAS